MIILGSTGSIGVNTLNICRRFNIEVEALVAGNNIELLNKQIKEFNPKYVAISDCKRAKEVNAKRVFCADEGILELLEVANSKKVVNALVGYAGLMPTIKALELNKELSLANKESLVIAGSLIDASKIVPIDSEHFGLWYLKNNRSINKLIITASGGAFRDWDIEDIKDATYQDALKHPNWSMGSKITIDSASMVNKLFELLEAKWLFDTTNIDAVIEKNSVVHALIEFKDGSTTAHLSDVDMKLPIAYAILDRVEDTILKPLDLLELNKIDFREIQESRYPIWQIKEHLLNNPKMGAVLNAANEVAIDRFSKGEFGFFKMIDIILQSYRAFDNINFNSIDDIVKLDREVRDFTRKIS